MRFSILIPVYNTKAYLADCMDSVLKQNFEDYEVILVDDGSTDGAGELCDSYANLRVKVVHKENQGLLMARRTAIELAKGEYCIFLDSDDALMSGALAGIDSKLRQTQADILIYNAALVYDDDFSRPRIRKAVFPDRVFIGENEKVPIYEKLLNSWDLNSIWSKAIRAQLMKNDDTDYEAIKENSMGEDLLQSFYPISRAQTIEYTGDCYYYYRQSATGMTRALDIERLDRRFAAYNPEVLKARVRYAKLWGIWDEAHMLDIYRATLRHIRSIFNDTFPLCNSSETKREWCDFAWEALLPEKVMETFEHPKLGLSLLERVQLNAIFSHQYRLLRMLVIGQKMRRAWRSKIVKQN